MADFATHSGYRHRFSGIRHWRQWPGRLWWLGLRRKLNNRYTADQGEEDVECLRFSHCSDHRQNTQRNTLINSEKLQKVHTLQCLIMAALAEHLR